MRYTDQFPVSSLECVGQYSSIQIQSMWIDRWDDRHWSPAIGYQRSNGDICCWTNSKDSLRMIISKGRRIKQASKDMDCDDCKTLTPKRMHMIRLARGWPSEIAGVWRMLWCTDPLSLRADAAASKYSHVVQQRPKCSRVACITALHCGHWCVMVACIPRSYGLGGVTTSLSH